MKLLYSPDARRQLNKLPLREKPKILRKIIQLLANPYAGKKLSGELSQFRSLRAWPYRIIYQVRPTEQIVFINLIQHRGQVYK